MTVALVGYSYSGQSGQDIQITRTYRVDGITISNIETARAAVLGATGIPSMGATATGNAKWFAIEARPLDTRNPNVWEVTAQARTAQPDDDIFQATSGTVIDKGLAAQTEHVLQDRTPTGAVFQLTPTSGVNWPKRIWTPQPRMTAWFDKVHDTFPHAAGAALLGAINSATWNGYPVTTWLCTAIDTHTVRREGGTRYLSRYEFAYKAETWRPKFYDLTWNSFQFGGAVQAVSVTGTLDVYKDANFNSYGFTL